MPLGGKEHRGCAHGSFHLPDGVLDVETAANPHARLVETHSGVGDYMTLSHCWGGADFLRRTRKNIDRFKTSLD
ncbi:uncharacterized protein P884DRAFT_212413 [Thermothelomyces heterothallicus CBS 202.75]|uniref:uncharacterized protein n=1 Tax=Thermothelomyces heterothallicus CBS 202.75 TaxID=1149848 RepID=UPI00374232C3